MGLRRKRGLEQSKAVLCCHLSLRKHNPRRAAQIASLSHTVQPEIPACKGAESDLQPGLNVGLVAEKRVKMYL